MIDEKDPILSLEARLKVYAARAERYAATEAAAYRTKTRLEHEARLDAAVQAWWGAEKKAVRLEAALKLLDAQKRALPPVVSFARRLGLPQRVVMSAAAERDLRYELAVALEEVKLLEVQYQRLLKAEGHTYLGTAEATSRSIVHEVDPPVTLPVPGEPAASVVPVTGRRRAAVGG